MADREANLRSSAPRADRSARRSTVSKGLSSKGSSMAFSTIPSPAKLPTAANASS